VDNPERHVTVRVGADPIEAVALVAAVARHDSGATVLFLGTVRDHSEGREGVTHLEYEVYAEMVERSIEALADEALAKWPLLAVAVEHRSGVVVTGEVSVGVCVAAEHRSDAFEAARYLIDELKARAPIWKKEHWPGGSEWSRGS
jgi:molybdopterin synthase catalytic subunit